MSVAGEPRNPGQTDPQSAATVHPVPWWRHGLLVYLAIGGLSFTVDAGLLMVLSVAVGFPVWLAATVGYWTSVVVNFSLNRRTMAGLDGKLRWQSVRFAILLAANYGLTLLILSVGSEWRVPVIVSKCLAVVLAIAANFVLYRRLVFA